MALSLSNASSRATSLSSVVSNTKSGFTVAENTTYTYCNIGIRRDNPAHALHVVGHTSAKRVMALSNGDSNLPSIAFTTSSTGFYKDPDGICFSSAGTRRFKIANNGWISIGSSNDPTELVDITGTQCRMSFASCKQRLVPSSCNGGGIYFGEPSNLTGGIEAAVSNDIAMVSVGLCMDSNLSRYIMYENGDTVFHTSSNYEAMRILNNGNIGIATSTPAYALELGVDSAAKPSTSTWTVVSDQRLKSDIVIADLDRCYEIVKNLPLKRFTWKDAYVSSNMTNDRSKLGWIAQEVESVFPKAVITQPERYGLSNFKTLDTDQIYAAMYGTVKKLQSMVDEVESRVVASEQALGL
jgi:hypothetical protein